MAIKKNQNPCPQGAKETFSQGAAESMYSQDQLAEAHKSFGAAKALVIVALRLSGKTQFTRREAAELITKFKNMEVGKQ